jgi:hypothetical protein
MTTQSSPFDFLFKLLILFSIVVFIGMSLAALSPLLLIGAAIADRGWQAGILPGLVILSPIFYLIGIAKASGFREASKLREACLMLVGQNALVGGALAWLMFK